MAPSLLPPCRIPLSKALGGGTIDVPTLDPGRVLRVPLKEVVRPGYERVVPGEGEEAPADWSGWREARAGPVVCVPSPPQAMPCTWEAGQRSRHTHCCRSRFTRRVALTTTSTAGLLVLTARRRPAGMPNSKTGAKGNLRLRFDVQFPRQPLSEQERGVLEVMLKDKY